MTRACIVAGLALTLGACTPQVRRPAPPVERVVIPVSEGYVAAADGARLFYRIVGSGQDTVVAIHGGPGVHMGSLVSLQPLAAGGTVIFYDQRGGGRSSLPGHPAQMTTALHVSDLDAVLRHFRIERATLLGHSWGGLLAGLYAVEHPQRVARMILVAPSPVRAQPHVFDYFARLPSLLGADSARFRVLTAAFDTTSAPHALCRQVVPILMRAGGARDTAAVNRVTDGMCSPAVPAEAIRHGWTTTPQWTLTSLGLWDLRERLRAVRAPTLVIATERDINPERVTAEWVSALPNARLLTMRDVGHFPYVEDPVTFARAVREFLGRN